MCYFLPSMDIILFLGYKHFSYFPQTFTQIDQRGVSGASSPLPTKEKPHMQERQGVRDTGFCSWHFLP